MIEKVQLLNKSQVQREGYVRNKSSSFSIFEVFVQLGF
jgi:hypothetical protein